VTFYGYSFREDFFNAVYHLYGDFYGGYYGVDYYNSPNFRNATFDALMDTFLNAKDEATVLATNAGDSPLRMS
jgi:hypothetical protein